MDVTKTLNLVVKTAKRLEKIKEFSPEERLEILEIFFSGHEVIEDLLDKMNDIPDKEENGLSMGGIKGNNKVEVSPVETPKKKEPKTKAKKVSVKKKKATSLSS